MYLMLNQHLSDLLIPNFESTITKCSERLSLQPHCKINSDEAKNKMVEVCIILSLNTTDRSQNGINLLYYSNLLLIFQIIGMT